MANKLPYFRWYPADAEVDDNFRAMDDCDIGFYLRCLNHAWINGGIPADPKERARVLRTRLDTANKRWERVGKCFVTSTSMPDQLINLRQETERGLASRKSQQASESAKVGSERRANADIRARVRSDSGSEYVSVLEVKKESSLPKPIPPIGTTLAHSRLVTDDWREWWAVWSAKRGTACEDKAARAWISVATDQDFRTILECTESYLGSGKCDDGHGFNPDTFLFEQNRTQFRARWPAKQPPKKADSLTDRTLALMKRRIAEGRPPL